MTRRILPHAIDAEASVLGAILLRNEVMAELGELHSRAFYVPQHGLVFEAMRELDEKSRPIDQVTLEEMLRKREKIDAVGGVSFLSKLALKVPTADNVRHYADIVLDKHAARSLILAASMVVERGYGDYGDIEEFQADAMAALGDAVASNAQTGPKPSLEWVKELARDLDRRASEDGMIGVRTGYLDLDHRTLGLQPRELVILAGRPAMGKTALAMSIAKNCAARGVPVVGFSLEMGGMQLIARLVSSESGVSTTALRGNRLTRDHHSALTAGMSRVAALPLWVDETPGLSLSQVRARARHFAAKQAGDAVGLVIVDYLQLMRGPKEARQRSREQEIAEISGGLKALAKELGWPVLALSQLNRGVEARRDKRPQLADLRESGAIEQDADMVWLLYRDEVYNPDTAEKHIAELDIAKFRHGPSGVLKLRFEGEHARFSNLTLMETYMAK